MTTDWTKGCYQLKKTVTVYLVVSSLNFSLLVLFTVSTVRYLYSRAVKVNFS